MQGFKSVQPGTLWKLDFIKAKLSNDQLTLLIEKSQEALSINEDWSHNLVGEMKKGCEVKIDFPNEIDLGTVAATYLNEHFDFKNLLPGDVKMREAWVVSQFAGDYNPAHSHESLLSGIVYLKVPEGISKTFYDKDDPSLDGCIQFIMGNYHRPSLNNFGPRVILPEVGDLYLFPSYILHTVYPFFCEGERRCIAFNMDI